MSTKNNDQNGECELFDYILNINSNQCGIINGLSWDNKDQKIGLPKFLILKEQSVRIYFETEIGLIIVETNVSVYLAFRKQKKLKLNFQDLFRIMANQKIHNLNFKEKSGS